jgi:hypothetical protein
MDRPPAAVSRNPIAVATQALRPRRRDVLDGACPTARVKRDVQLARHEPQRAAVVLDYLDNGSPGGPSTCRMTRIVRSIGFSPG